MINVQVSMKYKVCGNFCFLYKVVYNNVLKLLDLALKLLWKFTFNFGIY